MIEKLAKFVKLKVFTFMSSNGERKYQLLSKIVKSFLSLPNGNASVERSVSDNKNTFTNERINLKEETLMAFRRAKEYARDRGGAHNVDTYRKSQWLYVTRTLYL